MTRIDSELLLIVYQLTTDLRAHYGDAKFVRQAELLNELSHRVLGHVTRKQRGEKSFSDLEVVSIAIEYLEKMQNTIGTKYGERLRAMSNDGGLLG